MTHLYLRNGRSGSRYKLYFLLFIPSSAPQSHLHVGFLRNSLWCIGTPVQSFPNSSMLFLSWSGPCGVIKLLPSSYLLCRSPFFFCLLVLLFVLPFPLLYFTPPSHLQFESLRNSFSCLQPQQVGKLLMMFRDSCVWLISQVCSMRRQLYVCAMYRVSPFFPFPWRSSAPQSHLHIGLPFGTPIPCLQLEQVMIRLGTFSPTLRAVFFTISVHKETTKLFPIFLKIVLLFTFLLLPFCFLPFPLRYFTPPSHLHIGCHSELYDPCLQV